MLGEEFWTSGEIFETFERNNLILVIGGPEF